MDLLRRSWFGWFGRRFVRALTGALWFFGLQRGEFGRKTALAPLLFGVGFVVTAQRDGIRAVILRWDDALNSVLIVVAAFALVFVANWVLAPYRLDRELRNEIQTLRDLRRVSEIRRMFADALAELIPWIGVPRPEELIRRWKVRFELLMDEALIPQARHRIRDTVVLHSLGSQEVEPFHHKERLMYQITQLCEHDFDEHFEAVPWARWPTRPATKH